jgi:flagellar basal-body rod protein FlgG
MSEFRFEKIRVPAELTLTQGAPVAGCFFVAGSASDHDGPERVGELLNGRGGFFPFQLPDGTNGYTRDGAFQVNAQGQLVTNNGYAVQPGITIPANAQSVTIGNDGTVSVTLPGQALPQSVGQLQIASFINPAGLEPKGGNIYAETAASGTPNAGTPGQNGLGSLQQGFVETSNVNVVEELVQMIQTQRAYELNSKAIQTSDQMLQKLAQL